MKNKNLARYGNTHNRKTYGESAFNALLKGYIKTAADRGYPFALTRDEFKQITQMDCYYCGAPPSKVKKIKNGHGEYIYNGVDRVDNSKGYSLDNSVTCCNACNVAKNAVPMRIAEKMVEFKERGTGQFRLDDEEPDP